MARPLLVNLWATPRSCSTSLMYSFAQRKDTKVFDEPLYAHYLTNINATGYRPYRNELVKIQNTDGNKVMENFQNLQLSAANNDNNSVKLLFCKHMAKQFGGSLDDAFLFDENTRNIILTRDPIRVFEKFEQRMGFVDFNDTGYKQQLELFEKLYDNKKCVVIDSEDLVSDSGILLDALCNDYLNVAFDSNMLKWEKGGLPNEDGIWAYYWYHTVHESTGFQKNSQNKQDIYKKAKEKFDSLPRDIRNQIGRAIPIYQKLYHARFSPVFITREQVA